MYGFECKGTLILIYNVVKECIGALAKRMEKQVLHFFRKENIFFFRKLDYFKHYYLIAVSLSHTNQWYGHCIFILLLFENWSSFHAEHIPPPTRTVNLRNQFIALTFIGFENVSIHSGSNVRIPWQRFRNWSWSRSPADNKQKFCEISCIITPPFTDKCQPLRIFNDTLVFYFYYYFFASERRFELK